MLGAYVVYDTCVMELTYIGCVERTGVLGGGGGAVVAHGSSGIVTLRCAYHPSVYHNCGSW